MTAPNLDAPDLDALRRLSEAATPGPWEGIIDDHGRHGLNFSVWAGDMDGRYITEQVMTSGVDACLIAAMRNALPWLLDQAARVTELEATVARVEQVCDNQAEYCGDNRLDTPSWVGTVRAALSSPASEKP